MFICRRKLAPKPNQTKPMANLTSKESALLCSIARGMDEPGCGWLHEVEPFNSDHVAAGVLGALMAKGLVTSHEEPETSPGYGPAYWVETTESGLSHAIAEVATRGWLSVEA
jgi:hypothetical protein